MAVERAGGAITDTFAAWGNDASQRILRLEQRRFTRDEAGEPPDPPRPFTWSIEGPAEIAYPAWPCVYEVYVGTVVLTTDTAATTDTTVDLLVDGVSKATATLPATATSAKVEVGVTVPTDSELRPEITAVGTGLGDLSIQVRVTP